MADTEMLFSVDDHAEEILGVLRNRLGLENNSQVFETALSVLETLVNLADGTNVSLGLLDTDGEGACSFQPITVDDLKSGLQP